MRLLALLLLAALPSLAAVKFVNAAAVGSNNGSSWANGWTSFSSVNWGALAPDDFVCVAGGTYSSSILPTTSGTSGHPITVRRAHDTDTVCGSTTAGWNSTFDNQVTMNEILIQVDFFTVDGAVPNGFKIVLPNVGGSNGGLSVGGPTNGMTIRYLEVSGPCGPTGCNQAGDARAIDLNHYNGSSYDLQNNVLLQFNNFHGQCTTLWSAHSTNMIIEHNRFADSIDTTPGNPNCHPNVVAEQDSTAITFRYNEITNWQVEGILACPTAACSSTWDIYGNIWHDPTAGSFPRVLEVQNSVSGPYHVYNNTFVNVYFLCASSGNGGSYAGGTIGENNLYYGNAFANCGLPTEDYDYSDKALPGEANGQGLAANPFMNYSTGNFQLAFNTNAGLTLSSPFNIDYLGVTRGGPAAWSRGAYQFTPAPSSILGGPGLRGGPSLFH